ncbi:MAG: heparinase II/III family protein [Planctomycetes bacterium]|nr:heparinase II/III family protein [Planctomycetota bacterium]
MASEARLTAAWGDSVPLLTDALLDEARRVLKLQDEASTGTQDQRYPSAALGPLAAAFRASGEKEFAKAAVAIYRHGLEREPLNEGRWTPGPNEDVLLIPHRLGDTECLGWFGALPVFLSSGLFDEDLLDQMVAWARAQLNHLAANIFQARNIRTTQADALLTHGLRFPFLPDAERWRRLGIDALNDCFNRQISGDGSSIEATGWYHYIVMNMSLRFWRLKQAMPDLGLQIRREQVAAMFDYHVATIEPDGRLTPIGDCWLTPPQAGGTLESVVERRSAVRKELGLPARPLPPSQFFPDACQAFLRSGWDPGATYLTFEATRRNGYHWHPARNAIGLSAFGRKMLTDAGGQDYDDRNPPRRWATSTRAHNTCNLNGLNQVWTPATFRYRSVDGWDLVDALYDGGYWSGRNEFTPGPGILGYHHRTCLWARHRFIAVLDHLHHRAAKDGGPDLECNWHFGPGKVTMDAAARRAIYRDGDAGLLLLFPVMPAGTAFGLHGGVHPLYPGPEGVGLPPIPGTWLRLSVAASECHNNSFATILVPFTGETPILEAQDVSDPARPRSHRLTLQWGDGRTDEVVWTRQLEAALEETGGMATDGALVHLERATDGAPQRALIFDGTYLRPHTLTDRAVPETFVWK